MLVDFNIILKGCKDGDRFYQKEIYNTFYPTVCKTCMRYSNTIEEGEDLIHDTFIKVFIKISNFNGTEPAQFGAWVKSLTKNHCIVCKRKKIDKPIQTDSNILDNIVDEIDTHVESEHSLKEILNAIQKLSPRCKSVFNLFLLDGYNHQEISEILNISVGDLNLVYMMQRIRLNNF